MTIHWKVVTKDNVGTATGAPEEIGTITTVADCKDVLGAAVVKASTATRTAAEASQGTFNLDWNSLANSNWRILSSLADGGAPATNIAEVVENPLFVPFLPIGQDFGNIDITCSFEAEEPQPTSDFAAGVGIAMADGAYPNDVMQNVDRIFTRCKYVQTCAEDVAGSDTSKEFGESIVIPGHLKEIVAVGTTINYDAAATAGEFFLGYLKWDTDAPNYAPMETLMPACHASLGTVVGGGIISRQSILPMHVPLPGVKTTWTPTSKSLVATSAAVAITTSLYCR